MLIRTLLVSALVTFSAAVPCDAAQRQQSLTINAARERARPAYKAGMEYLSAEQFDRAVKAFEEAIDLDPTFDMAHYMLGRTHMATKRYAPAVVALVKCRDLLIAESTKQIVDKREAEQYRRQRVGEINDRISALEIGPQNQAVRNEIQMLQERKRQLEDADRQLSDKQAVPAFVSVALGSAYFRSGKLAEAEKAYTDAVAADPRTGEAHNNLAVVYMETGRYDDAERSIKNAEKAGLKVSDALKDEIKKRRKGGGSD